MDTSELLRLPVYAWQQAQKCVAPQNDYKRGKDDLRYSIKSAGRLYLLPVDSLRHQRARKANRGAGEHHDDKHLAYTGGETVPPPTGGRLSYHAFFRLALLFGILHVATLVLSTLPVAVRPRKTALAYTVAIAISVFILVEEPESEEGSEMGKPPLA